ncbi:MAG TPA: DUF6644 family protein [Bryobacteraceae bacterium]
MSLISICESIQVTDLSIAIREGALYYPIIGGIHLLAIALFGGMVLAADVRLLGWGMKSSTVADVVGQLRAWKRFGFVVVVASGVLLGWAEPLKLYHSKSFWIKMALFLLVGVHALVFRKAVYGNPERLDEAASMPGVARLAAVLSVILWAGLVFSGRLIAFDE